ncbi:MAG TPA: hypothetical protein VHV32_19415 [Candidatus Angelobacter sp.]|jgi:hypothetical protein|nr:hypothetical protein [Candidatus Angelobacter sp.]
MRNLFKPLSWSAIFGLLLILLLLQVKDCYAQNARFDGVVQARSGLPAPGAFVAVCVHPCTVPSNVSVSNPPSVLVGLCSSASDAVCTSPNPVTADGLGNYHFYAKPGRYDYVYYGSGLTASTLSDQILPCDPSNCSISGTATVGGTLGVTGALTGSSAAFTGTNPLQVNFCDKWIAPSQNIQTVLNTCTSGGHFFLSQGVYAQSANHITLKSGQELIGAGQFATTITCTGAGACITLDSTTTAVVEDLQVQIDTNAAALCLDMQNTTADSKWNRILGVQCQTSSGTLTAGQIGFRMMASTNFALYWNTFVAVQALNLETGFQLTNLGAFTTNGTNDNKFYSLSCHFFTTCMSITKFATENQIYGLTGSASGNVANNTLLVVGNSSSAANWNAVYGLVADTGTGGQAYQITSGVSHTLLDDVVDAAGRASTNAGTATIIHGFRNAASQADLYPNGTAGNPPIGDLAAPTTGIFFSSGGVMEVSTLGTAHIAFGTAGPRVGSTDGHCFASAGDPNGTTDTCTGRAAAGIVSADTTTPGNALGSFEGRAYISSGTAAVLTGTGACATFSTQTGGSSVGRATCTGTTGASTFIITPGITAPNGWVCEAFDQTTRANLLQQTSNTTTACTLTSTSVTQNDVIVFKAVAF